MTTVHLVYPHGERISCPDAIGRKLGHGLRSLGFQVIYYDLTDTRVITPKGVDEVLLGHPHVAPWTIFRRSMRQPGWRRVIAMSPFCHGDDVQCAFLDGVLPYVDLYLAITGRYWFESVGDSKFSHWLPKMVHVDLAVDRNDFPAIKTRFNPPGRRRFLYIGHTAWFKNTSYLTQIARAMPETQISWIGRGSRISRLNSLGGMDFDTEIGRQAVKQHDFLLTVGNADANPTTILESMAWGLIPVCTKQSGYSGYDGIANVPLDDVGGAVQMLRSLQEIEEASLLERQASNWRLLDSHFNWDRFVGQVASAIESDCSPQLLREPLGRKLALTYATLTSPHSIARPKNFVRFVGMNAVRRLRATGRSESAASRDKE